MGVDKARVPYPGREPMALAVARQLGGLCGRVALVRRRVPDPLPWPPGTWVVVDEAPEGDTHPLWGVAAALGAAQGPVAVVVPCDQPHLELQALAALVAAAPAVAVGPDGVVPLVAALPTAWRDRATELARAGRSARELVADCVRVPFPPGSLRQLTSWADAGRPGPVAALVAGLPWLDDAARDRVVAGERVRLAARGVIDPGVG